MSEETYVCQGCGKTIPVLRQADHMDNECGLLSPEKFQTRPCFVCGETFYVTVEHDKLVRWLNGELIQDVWPDKSPEWRELLISGTHPECWEGLTSDAREVLD